MTREIRFRGKTLQGEWVYGMLLTKKDEAFIVCEEEASYGLDDGKELFAVEWSIAEVIPETVGQFTGLKDKNGKEIYEGDILQYVIMQKDRIEIIPCIVYFDMGAFYIKDTRLHGRFDLLSEVEPDDITIITNTYDSPDLLEVERC